MAGNEIYWEGQSGKRYKHWIHRIGTFFGNEPGNYIFAKEVEPGSWLALYIGQAASLEGRFGNQEKKACAIQNGATHVHAHTTPAGGEARRTAEQADLVARWKPVCNE